MSIMKSMSGRTIRTLTLAAASAFAISGATAYGDEPWVGTWGTALHEPDLGVPGLANTGFNNQTLRQIVHTSVGGRNVRVRLSTFGAKGLVIGAAHIALSASGAGIVPNSDRTLTFGGKTSITIPAGALVLSDPVGLEVSALSDLAVTIFVPENTGPATWHFESRQTSYVSAPGDFTASAVLPSVAMPVAWFWLAGVDVTASSQTGAVVILGDSITDGTHSTQDANKRWPDQFAQRLMALPGNRTIGVLNKGIAGGRLLHDSLGPSGLARFDRDVLAQTGVMHVIVQLGNNDIFTLNPAEDVTTDQIIQGHRQLIERAHEQGLKIYGCTLNPVEGFLLPGTPLPVFSPAGEVKRQAVNAWIRMSGEYDGVIDFDQVLRDPNAPTKILPSLDSGDHAHPTDAGYKALADAIDLKLFSKRENGNERGHFWGSTAHWLKFAVVDWR
jgi:lysophospholipase L1-like esterase